jgi:hypothetical protein
MESEHDLFRATPAKSFELNWKQCASRPAAGRLCMKIIYASQ